MAKKIKEKEKLTDKAKRYDINEAVKLVKDVSYTSFDGTVELAVHLGIDPRKSDQQVRGTLKLPSGLGKKVKVAVITKEDKHDEAKKAGADVVGADELVDDIKKGFLDFDVLIATPNMMRQVGTLGKILGRRGLMPSPKTGTVTQDLESAIKDFKEGKVEYRADRYGIVHMPIGKVSFDAEKLLENFKVIYDTLMKAKPSGAKGHYLKSISLAPTMGPVVKVDTNKIKL